MAGAAKYLISNKEVAIDLSSRGPPKTIVDVKDHVPTMVRIKEQNRTKVMLISKKLGFIIHSPSLARMFARLRMPA